MNILVLSHEYPPVGGGGANACKYLSREFARLGHSVTIITAQYHNSPSEEIIDGVRVIRVKALRKKVETSSFVEMLSFLVSAYCKADSLCREEEFNICQVFFGIPSGPIALLLKKKYGIPYVIRFGGGDIPGAQKRFAIIYTILAPVLRSIWKNAKKLVANSEVLKKRALAFEDQYDITVIPNGVDTEIFKRKETIEDYNEIRMLFVSRLIETKGLQYIIPRMKEINDRVGKRVYLTIVGEGPYRADLEALLNASNQELVRFVGRKTGEELLEQYEKANLFMFPSLSEGMPNVVLEAMAMNLPIAMSDCGGSQELIRENGFASKIECFVDSLVELGKEERLLLSYGRNSRKRVEEYFDWASKAKEYLGVFNE